MICQTTEPIERGQVLDTAGCPVVPGRYMLMRGGVDSLMLDVVEDESTLELIAVVDNLPLEPSHYRLAELQPGLSLRRLPDDYPRDCSDLDL